MNTPAVRYVICKRDMYGRTKAQRGLSYDTQADAQAKLNTWPENYRKRFTIETRAVEADDSSERMTCQCCGRKYLARTGTMAHHGYTRQGGWQTASCSGAKQLPFEKDHAALDRMIVNLEKQAASLRKFARDTKAGKVEVQVKVTNYDVEVTGRFVPRPELRVEFTKDTFAAVIAQYPKSFRHHTNSFETWQNQQANRAMANAVECESYRQECITRRATWKHTHDYQPKAKEWAAI
jgi:hypothetical protein